ncbi:MAG: hypothetical protein V3V10_04000 [Planctomycetota bacterium]
MRTVMLSLMAVFALSVSAQDTKAEQIRKTFQKYQDSVATLTWTNTTSALRQEVERERSTTVVMLPGGVGMVSASATKSRASGIASMLGGGGAKDSGWKLNIGEGIACESVSEDSDTNLRFFNAPSKLAGVSFPEKVSVPALAEEVLIISAHNKTLKFAKFFRLARINAIIEDGQIYGLDGSIGDCLGALVVTLDGKVLGIVGEMKADEESGGGGIGGMLGGLDNPGAGSNRVLLTPSVFAASIAAANKAIENKSDATSDKPAATNAPLKLELASGENTADVYGAKAGIKVTESPAAGSPEDKAGLKKGDLIVKYGDTSVTADTKLEDFKKWYAETKSAKVTVARAGSTDLTDLILK